jgi:hypothetical protein
MRVPHARATRRRLDGTKPLASDDTSASGSSLGGKFAATAAAAEAGAPQQRSIYDMYTSRKRWTILLAISFAAVLAPFSDTIYLPALTVVASSLNTTIEMATTSVSIYMCAPPHPPAAAPPCAPQPALESLNNAGPTAGSPATRPPPQQQQVY